MSHTHYCSYCLTVVLFCASSCARESADKKSPTVQAAAPEKDAMPNVKDSGSPEPKPAPVPASTQEAAIRALAESIVALPAGLLTTVSELKTHLVLPADLELEFKAQQDEWGSGFEKKTVLKFGPDSSMTLTLTMQDGSWEAPKGNSARRALEPIVESIELSGPGSLGLAPPAGARQVATQRPADAAPMISWPGGNYLSENQAEPSFYLGHFIGRAPFHFTEVERQTLEQALIDISKAMSKGGLDLPAYMAKTYAQRRVTDTKQFGYRAAKSNDIRALVADAPPEAPIYDFGAARIVVGPNDVEVVFVGPMKMPAFFAAHKVKRIVTSFAHNVGQRTEAIEVPGLRIFPGNYFFGETRRYSGEDEMGTASEAMLLSLSIVEK